MFLWLLSGDGKKVLPFSECTHQPSRFKPLESQIGA